jgi:hypothetical protein
MFRGASKLCTLFYKTARNSKFILATIEISECCENELIVRISPVLGQQILRVSALLVNFIFVNRNVNKNCVFFQQTLSFLWRSF